MAVDFFIEEKMMKQAGLAPDLNHLKGKVSLATLAGAFYCLIL